MSSTVLYSPVEKRFKEMEKYIQNQPPAAIYNLTAPLLFFFSFFPDFPWLSHNLAYLFKKLYTSFDRFAIYLLGIALAFFRLHWPPFTLILLWPNRVKKLERYVEFTSEPLSTMGQHRPQEPPEWVGEGIGFALRSDSGLEFLRSFLNLITSKSHESLRLAFLMPWEP